MESLTLGSSRSFGFWVGSSGDEEKLPLSRAPHHLPLQTLASYKLMCLLSYLLTWNCDTLPPFRRKWGDSSVRVSVFFPVAQGPLQAALLY